MKPISGIEKQKKETLMRQDDGFCFLVWFKRNTQADSVLFSLFLSFTYTIKLDVFQISLALLAFDMAFVKSTKINQQNKLFGDL